MFPYKTGRLTSKIVSALYENIFMDTCAIAHHAHSTPPNPPLHQYIHSPQPTVAATIPRTTNPTQPQHPILNPLQPSPSSSTIPDRCGRCLSRAITRVQPLDRSKSADPTHNWNRKKLRVTTTTAGLSGEGLRTGAMLSYYGRSASPFDTQPDEEGASVRVEEMIHTAQDPHSIQHPR